MPTKQRTTVMTKTGYWLQLVRWQTHPTDLQETRRMV